ncbi:MAG: 30S ribosomal protein S6 [Anaerolineae bacterium]|nr:30S ribosomal protein S6 [Anaerolineae bacterium]
MTKRNDYELIFIAHPDLDEEGVAELVAKVSGWIEAADGQVIQTIPWGRRRLAYPIRKQTEGSYVLLRASLTPASIGKLERELKLSESVLRYLLVRTEEPLPAAKRPTTPRPAATRLPAEYSEAGAQEG